MGLLENIKSLVTEEDIMYIGELPLDAPDNASSITRIKGRPAEQDLEGIVYRQPSVRVLVRDLSYQNAETRIQLILEELTEPKHVLTDPEIMGLDIESDVIDIGRDEKRRVSLYTNLSIKCENK